MILEQPVDAVGLAVFFIGRQRQDDVAIWNVAFLSHADEVGYRDGIAVLHVLRAATVEVAVLLDELERIGAPILALRLNDVQMSDNQNGFQFRPCRAAISRHHVALAIIRTQHNHVRLRKSCIEQPLRHGLRRHGGAADRIGGVDFNELLENVMRVLARSRIDLRNRGRMCAQAEKNRGNAAGSNTIFQEMFSQPVRESSLLGAHAIV